MSAAVEPVTLEPRPQVPGRGAGHCWMLLQQADAARCGGKALNLARMLGLGLPVPPGVVLTDSLFQQFVDVNGLRPEIAATLAGLDVEDLAALQAASTAIAERLVAAPLPAALTDTLCHGLPAWLTRGTIIVRSSAIGEDSQEASFAGQLDSIAGVRHGAELATAVRRCWASYWSARALAYQRHRGYALRGMGCILQVEVAARWAGVLFTRSPRAGEGEKMLLEYCLGSGEQLVQGAVSPGRIVADRVSGQWTQQCRPVQPGAAGRDPGDDHALPWVEPLLAAGRRLEQVLGGAGDIEWLVDAEGNLQLVQLRPITVATASAARSEAPRRRCVWSNANINENFPEPVTPLLYSFVGDGYRSYFRGLGEAFGIAPKRLQAMEPALRNLVGAHGARLYYNLSNIHRVIRQMPCGDLLAGYFNQFVGAQQCTAPEADAAPRFTGVSLVDSTLEVAKVGVQVARQYLRIERRLRAFEQTVDAFAAHTDPTVLDAMVAADLREALRQFLDIRLHGWTGAALADAAAMVCYGLLKREIQAAFPHQDCGALHNNVLKGLPGLVSGLPAVELWQLAQVVRFDDGLRRLFAGDDPAAIWRCLHDDPQCAGFCQRLDSYLSRWGFRCSGELMLTRPSFQERPEQVVALLQTYLQVDADSPQAVMLAQERDRLRQTAELLDRLAPTLLHRLAPWPTRARRVRLLLPLAQGAIALRERARLKQALLYTRLRRIALRAGAVLAAQGVLDDADDVFFLTHTELDLLLSGSALLPGASRPLVAMRRAELARLAAQSPPDHFELDEGEAWSSAAAATDNGSLAGVQQDLASDGCWYGTSACGGQVTARAAVLSDVSEAHKLHAGDVLVTRQTDPGWAPLFFLIRGLIIERGGMLSHGAIIAREFGIPALVDVPEATRRIEHGCTVHLDGDRGVARRVRAAHG